VFIVRVGVVRDGALGLTKVDPNATQPFSLQYFNGRHLGCGELAANALTNSNEQGRVDVLLIIICRIKEASIGLELSKDYIGKRAQLVKSTNSYRGSCSTTSTTQRRRGSSVHIQTQRSTASMSKQRMSSVAARTTQWNQN